MKLVGTLVMAILAAFAGQRLGRARAAPAEPAEDSAELARVVAGIQELRRENERLAGEIERRADAMVAARSSVAEIDEGEIAAALERWRAAHPAEARGAGAGRAEAVARTNPAELELASIPMSEFVQVLSREGLTHLER